MTVYTFPRGGSLPQQNLLVNQTHNAQCCGSGTLTTPVNGMRQEVDSIWYTYHLSIDEWISDEKETLIFNKTGGANGTLLRIGEVKGDKAKYIVLSKARIMRITTIAGSGLVDKELEILVNNSPVFSFNLASLTYINSDVAPIDLTANNEIQINVKFDVAQPIFNVVATLSIGWLL